MQNMTLFNMEYESFSVIKDDSFSSIKGIKEDNSFQLEDIQITDSDREFLNSIEHFIQSSKKDLTSISLHEQTQQNLNQHEYPVKCSQPNSLQKRNNLIQCRENTLLYPNYQESHTNQFNQTYYPLLLEQNFSAQINFGISNEHFCFYPWDKERCPNQYEYNSQYSQGCCCHQSVYATRPDQYSFPNQGTQHINLQFDKPLLCEEKENFFATDNQNNQPDCFLEPDCDSVKYYYGNQTCQHTDLQESKTSLSGCSSHPGYGSRSVKYSSVNQKDQPTNLQIEKSPSSGENQGYYPDPFSVLLSSEVSVDRHREAYTYRGCSRKHDCHICAYSTSRKPNFQNHLKTHTNESSERPHRCSECGKTFRFLLYLNAHTFNHTGQRLHKCEYSHCEYETRKKHNLKQHVITKHTKKFDQFCQVCGKGFCYPCRLKKHMTNCHNDMK